MGGISERDSLRLLETAFDAGVRHFDVAPAYGHGQAERCLGKFLQGKRDQVTVATKYGILPPAQARLLDSVRSLIRPVVSRMPAVRKRVAQAAAGMRAKARFSAEEAAKSLEHTRRELGLEAIDVWLLHEVTAEDLDGSDLLPFLLDARQRGAIGAFGVGGDRSHLSGLWQRHPEYCSVLQFGWSVLERKIEFPGAFLFHYRAVSQAVAVRKLFANQPTLCRRWSDRVEADLADPKALIATLLQAALAANPEGIVLFSSRVADHIRANVQAAEEAGARERGQRFLDLLTGARNESGIREKSWLSG